MQFDSIRNLARCVAIATLGVIAVVSSNAQGAYVANFSQQGNDVVLTGAGTINLAGLSTDPGSSDGPNNDTGYVFSKYAILGVGPASDSLVDKFVNITGPSTFGSGSPLNASSGTGDMVEIAEYFSVIDVPTGYVSGSQLNGSSTFDNQTFTTMKLTPGIYTWTWGSGPTADSFTLNIAVPEPCSVSMLALAGLGLLARRRRGRLNLN